MAGVGRSEHAIAALWISGPLSYLEQLCLKSFVDAGHHVTLYRYEEVRNVPDGIEIADADDILPRDGYLTHARTGSPALHSDLFRYRLLEKTERVIWADTDAYCLRPFRTDTGHFFGWESARHINGGVLGMPRDSEALGRLLEFTRDEFPIPPWLPPKRRRELERAHEAGAPVHAGDLPWGVWGPHALTHFLHETGEARFAFPTEVLYPVPYAERRRMLQPGQDFGGVITERTCSIHFYGRRMRARIAQSEPGAIPRPGSLLARLIEKHGIVPSAAPLMPKVPARAESAPAAEGGTAPKILLVSTMKNEGPYVLEWLAHHRAIGFDSFLIYTNDCEDGTDLLLDRLDKAGLVHHRRNRVLRRGPHKSALKHAMDDPVYRDASWVFVGDADEFLNIHVGNGHVRDLIAAHPDADAIPVAWRLFGNGGRVGMTRTVRTELDVCETAARDGGKAAFVKSLFRRDDRVERLGLHGPVYAEGVAAKFRSADLAADPGADPLRPAGPDMWRIAQVNHYAVRTVDSFLLKRDRGRANHVGGRLEIDYWRRWNGCGDTDRSILRHEKAVAREVAALRRDPIVAHLDDGAWEWHRLRLTDLLRDEETAALRAALIDEAGASPGAAARAAAAQRLRVKAPKRHAKRLEMLSRMPKQGRCAEIGVWNGAFSAEILDVTRPRELVLIDPWDLLAASDKVDWNHAKHGDAAAMGEMYDQVRRMYAEAPEVVLRKGFSEDVLADYPDDYFDWVYIDGNHQYEFVRRDLELAFAKVRDGGIVAGDDFFWKRDGRMHVREAVLDVMRERGMTGRPQRIGQQFMLEVCKGA